LVAPPLGGGFVRRAVPRAAASFVAPSPGRRLLLHRPRGAVFDPLRLRGGGFVAPWSVA